VPRQVWGRIIAFGHLMQGCSLLRLFGEPHTDKQSFSRPGDDAGADPSVPLEQLWCLVRCAGHVLADSGSGETPMLPLPLAACATEAAAAGRPDAAEGLGVALLETLALALDPTARPVISPRCWMSAACPGSTLRECWPQSRSRSFFTMSGCA